MIIEIIQNLWGIAKSWSSEIIAGLIGMFIVWFLGLLPPKYQYHKRINFALKVSNAVSKIDISLGVKDKPSLIKIHSNLKEFLSNGLIEDIKVKEDISFNSNKTGCSYKISTFYDEAIDKNFVVVSSFNSFNIGFFGKIKGLTKTIEEIQSIMDCLTGLERDKDKVTVHITITPRKDRNGKDRMQIKYNEENFSTTYNLKNIKIVNNGIGSLKQNINTIFYEWLTSLL